MVRPCKPVRTRALQGNLIGVKLCRFELKSSPGQARSGIVYGAKIYETDGANPIGTYEAEDVRPLSPVGLPPSIRFFDPSGVAVETLMGEEKPAPFFTYGNPACIIGPSMIVPLPGFSNAVDFQNYIAVVIAQPGMNVPLEQADEMVLGLTLCTVLVARDVERDEKRVGVGAGRSRDFTIALGPVLTTPDELEEVVTDDSRGRRYKLAATAKLNGLEVRIGDVEDLGCTIAEAIVGASESVMLMAGDVLAIGPLAPPTGDTILDPGDEIQIAVERLGTLSLKIAL